MKYEISLPGLPKMTNSMMSSWRARYGHAKKWKVAVALECHRQKIPLLKKARLTLTRFSAVESDFDGLVSGFKHLIDGLVEAGVLPSDKMSVIGQPIYRWEFAKRGKGRVTIAIEDLSLGIQDEVKSSGAPPKAI
jgi:hypothetical protein